MLYIHFILSEPAVPGNIGASARALKTMGFRHLRLVRPVDHLGREARMLAHGAGEVLENASVYEDLSSALAGLDFVIGTSARKKTSHYDYYPVGKIPEILRQKGKTIRQVGVVFGKEESGLSNADFRMCDIISMVPMVSDFPSLNLAQAVMLFAYTLSPLAQGQPRNLSERISTGFSDPGSFRALTEKLGRVLEKLSIPGGSNLHHRILERIAILGEDDIHLLHSVCNAMIRKEENEAGGSG